MLSEPAQYLLRFDDLCPTLRREHWRQFVSLIEEFHIQPILAVVPENRDPELEIDAPDPAFWEQMRALESAGAAIALHGYRHLCMSRGRSLTNLSHLSEFAGVAEKAQREWVRAGLAILRGHGLTPRLFVAPRHGFDRATLRALRAGGIFTISDGLARVPFQRGGVTWIPQQFWSPMEKSRGLWTICIHPNTTRDEDVPNLREFLRSHVAQFTSVERVFAEFPARRLSMIESVYSTLALARMRASKLRKRG